MDSHLSNDPSLMLNDEYLDDCSDDSDDQNQSKNAPLREQDRFLPIANIAKIMKRAIPENGKIAKDARECIQECVSEFISFITSEASERCQNEKRKTINGEDILYAMVALGFDNYVEPLTLYLHKYRETTKTDRNLSGADSTFEEPSSTDFNQQNLRNGIAGSTVNNGGVATTNGSIASGGNGGGGVVLGQIGESILYYQNDQNQTFQL